MANQPALFESSGPAGMPATEIRGLSMTQPYATAVALSLKKIETRSFRVHFRGLLAIHAAKGFPREERDFATVEHTLGRLPARIPRCAIVAVVRLADMKPTLELETQVSAIERMYGNYGPGRWGWMLEDLWVPPEPVPIDRGWQGLWRLSPDLSIKLVSEWERRPQ